MNFARVLYLSLTYWWIYFNYFCTTMYYQSIIITNWWLIDSSFDCWITGQYSNLGLDTGAVFSTRHSKTWAVATVMVISNEELAFESCSLPAIRTGDMITLLEINQKRKEFEVKSLNLNVNLNVNLKWLFEQAASNLSLADERSLVPAPMRLNSPSWLKKYSDKDFIWWTVAEAKWPVVELDERMSSWRTTAARLPSLKEKRIFRTGLSSLLHQPFSERPVKSNPIPIHLLINIFTSSPLLKFLLNVVLGCGCVRLKVSPKAWSILIKTKILTNFEHKQPKFGKKKKTFSQQKYKINDFLLRLTQWVQHFCERQHRPFYQEVEVARMDEIRHRYPLNFSWKHWSIDKSHLFSRLIHY